MGKKRGRPQVLELQDANLEFVAWCDAQLNFIESDDDITVFCAGVGTGKSTCGGAWALQQMLKYPQADGMICANTYDQLVNASMKSMFAFLDQLSNLHGRKIYKWNQQTKILQIDAPGYTGKIYCRSLDGKGGSLLGFEVLWIWVDEVLKTPPETYDILTDRNRQKVNKETGEVYGPTTPIAIIRELEEKNLLVKNQIKLTTTPDFLGAKWLHDLIYDPEKIKAREEQGVKLTEYKAKTLENPHLSAQKKAQYAAKYSGPYAMQQLEGEWAVISPGQGVYSDDFSTYTHLGEFEYNPFKPLILGFDFGLRHPACVVCQEDSEDRLIVLTEYQGDNQTTKAFISDVLDYIAKFDRVNKDLEIYCDVAGTHRQSQSGEADTDVLHQLTGVVPISQWLEIKDSIQLVRERLNSLTNGRPKLMFDSRHCELLKQAMLGGYHWPETNTGAIQKNPVKDDFYDHLCDALRYIIANKYSRTSDQVYGRRKNWKQPKNHNLIRYRSRY